MNQRKENALRAEETLAILKKGRYSLQNGEERILYHELKEAIRSSILIRSFESQSLIDEIKKKPFQRVKKRVFTVANEPTLSAAKRLSSHHTRVMVLNLASAKHPGGGFLKGSMAQEESLAVSSGLYVTLTKHLTMYEENKKRKGGVYSDNCIYSPRVSVFRDENGDLLEDPYTVSFLTMPAVNARIVKSHEVIRETMKRRIEKIAAISLYYGYDHLLLGAFGCGVFQNQPYPIATSFKTLLKETPWYQEAFKTIHFAVLDTTKDQNTFQTFQRVLGNENF
jgi:uncharacterized protein (TIGR02452 family)